MNPKLRLVTGQIASAVLFSFCMLPAYAGADPVSPADKAINQLRSAREAVYRAMDNNDCVLADAADTVYDTAMASYMAALDSGDIGEYESEVIDRIFKNMKDDLDGLWAERFKKLLENCDPSNPTALQLGSEYDAAEVFRPKGNTQPYRALPPGVWHPAPEPGQAPLIGVGEMLDAVSIQQQREPKKHHEAPEPEAQPSPTPNPCSSE